MARIRSIKPEFWRSPSTAAASPWARLLYIAMWNWADDYGVGEWTPRELLGFAFPNDAQITDAEFQSLCTEVATCFDTTFYVSSGRRYYCIPEWDKHQKNERRAHGKYPRPEDSDSSSDPAFSVNAEMHGTSVRPRGKSPAGTGEQGNRGTGTYVQPPVGRKYPIQFDEWWALYPRKESKAAALKAWQKAIKLVAVEDLMKATQAYTLLMLGQDRQFIKLPAGWLNDGKWDDDFSTPASVSLPPRDLNAGMCTIHGGYPLPCRRCGEADF